MSEIKNVLSERDMLREQVDLYKRYTKYLREWYREHSTPEFEGMDPVSFEEYCANEANEFSTYTVEVDVNESSHIIASYDKVITVEAPSDLNMDQLKGFIDLSSSFSIEERIDPKVDALDAVNLEIYDYDLSLIEEKKG